MPRRNKIALQGLIERVVDMFHNQKLSQADIAQTLRDEGYDVSKAGVGRTLASHASQVKAFKEATNEAVAIVRELKNTPGLDIAETTVQMLQVKLLNAVKGVDPMDVDDMELKDLFSAVQANTLAQSRIAKVRLDYAKGYKAGIIKAAEVIKEESAKGGISEKSMDIIRRKVLALKDVQSE